MLGLCYSGFSRKQRDPIILGLILFGIFKEAKGPIILGPRRVSVVLRRLASVRTLRFRPAFCRSSGPDELALPSALSAARPTWPSAHGSSCQHGSDRSRLCGRTSSTADNDAAWRNLFDVESRKIAKLWRSARKASVSQKPHPSCGLQRTHARIMYRQRTTRRVVVVVVVVVAAVVVVVAVVVIVLIVLFLLSVSFLLPQ